MMFHSFIIEHLTTLMLSNNQNLQTKYVDFFVLISYILRRIFSLKASLSPRGKMNNNQRNFSFTIILSAKGVHKQH